MGNCNLKGQSDVQLNVHVLLTTKLLFSNSELVKKIWKLDINTEMLHVQGNLVTSFELLASRKFVDAEWEGKTCWLRLDFKRVLHVIYLNSLAGDPIPSLHRKSLLLCCNNIPIKWTFCSCSFNYLHKILRKKEVN